MRGADERPGEGTDETGVKEEKEEDIKARRRFRRKDAAEEREWRDQGGR